MDKPIQVGDLVQIVHSCCGEFIGTVATVISFKEPATGPCATCGEKASGLIRAKFDREKFPLTAPVAWLKRIPPIEELEGQSTEEDLREPA